MPGTLEPERRRNTANPKDLLPERLVGALREVRDFPGLLAHDAKGFAFQFSAALDMAGVDIDKFVALTRLPKLDYIKASDAQVTDCTPKLDFTHINPRRKAMPDFMETLERSVSIHPHISVSLMNLRDAMGFFIALNNDVNEVEPDPELEPASTYLDRLKARKMPLAPLCEFYDSTLLNKDQDITINGIEFIALMNLLQNAQAHNGGRMNTGTSSTIEYGELTHDFTVKNIAGPNLPRSDMSLAELAEDGHYGKLITGVMSAMLGKVIEHPSDPTLFIARAKILP